MVLRATAPSRPSTPSQCRILGIQPWPLYTAHTIAAIEVSHSILTYVRSLTMASSSSSTSGGDAATLRQKRIFASKLYFDVSPTKVPLIYSPAYDIAFLGIEKLHPFDSSKWGRVCQFLISAGVLDKKRIVEPIEASKDDLLVVHSEAYLESLKSSPNVAMMVEDYTVQVPPVAMFPNCLVQKKLLYPFRKQVGGTVLAAKLAKERGCAVNVGGGFHHCSSERGGGFCVYADISLCIHYAFARLNISRVMIIDLDAHQGNGHERDFSADTSYLLYQLSEQSGTTTDVYLSRLDDALEVAGRMFDPELIVYNAGTDILDGDPLGRLKGRATARGAEGGDAGKRREEAERLVRRAESVLDKEAARSKAPHSPSTKTTAKEVEEIVSEPISPSAAIPNIITITDEQSNHSEAVAVLPSSIAKEEIQAAKIPCEQQLLPTSTPTLDHLASPASPTTVAAASRTAITLVVAEESFAEKIESNLKVEEVLQINLKEADPLIGNLLVKSSRFNWKFRKKLKPDEVESAADASSITVASSASSPIRPPVSAKEKAISVSKLEATALSTSGAAGMTGANRELEGETMKGSRVVSPRSRAARGSKEDSAKLSIEKKQRRRGMAPDLPGFRPVDGALGKKMPPGLGPSREKKTSWAAGRVGQREESEKEIGAEELLLASPGNEAPRKEETSDDGRKRPEITWPPHRRVELPAKEMEEGGAASLFANYGSQTLGCANLLPFPVGHTAGWAAYLTGPITEQKVIWVKCFDESNSVGREHTRSRREQFISGQVGQQNVVATRDAAGFSHKIELHSWKRFMLDSGSKSGHIGPRLQGVSEPNLDCVLIKVRWEGNEDGNESLVGRLLEWQGSKLIGNATNLDYGLVLRKILEGLDELVFKDRFLCHKNHFDFLKYWVVVPTKEELFNQEAKSGLLKDSGAAVTVAISALLLVYSSSRYGFRLQISPSGVINRDEKVFRFARERTVPLVMLTSGGYMKSSARVIADSLANLSTKCLIDLKLSM
ncbi:unnamed protein product [Linum tenue]|uniref:Histone deacetylase domain-containing protein n=2 Tax=Linum tenue TaxID=586396 RepID=A0AAV0MQS9_9ROSI|nr:unnamed protein product [Linum tenue]